MAAQSHYRSETIGRSDCRPIVRLSADTIVRWDYHPNPRKYNYILVDSWHENFSKKSFALEGMLRRNFSAGNAVNRTSQFDAGCWCFCRRSSEVATWWLLSHHSAEGDATARRSTSVTTAIARDCFESRSAATCEWHKPIRWLPPPREVMFLCF